MTLVDRRVLYISYNGMLDPLGQSQVIPYLKELSHAERYDPPILELSYVYPRSVSRAV